MRCLCQWWHFELGYLKGLWKSGLNFFGTMYCSGKAMVLGWGIQTCCFQFWLRWFLALKMLGKELSVFLFTYPSPTFHVYINFPSAIFPPFHGLSVIHHVLLSTFMLKKTSISFPYFYYKKNLQNLDRENHANYPGLESVSVEAFLILHIVAFLRRFFWLFSSP